MNKFEKSVLKWNPVRSMTKEALANFFLCYWLGFMGLEIYKNEDS